MARAETFNLDNSASTIAARIEPIRWSRSAGGYPPTRLINPSTGNPFLEANSQEFKAGDMVYLNAGAVTQVLTAGSNPIAGFALTDATNVTSTNAEIEIMPVNDQDEYEMSLVSSTGSNTTRTATALLIGGQYMLAQCTVTNPGGTHTTNDEYMTVVDYDNTGTAPKRVKITGLVLTPSVKATTTYCRVRVRFLAQINTTADHSICGLQF
jgi:hypothetical protein